MTERRYLGKYILAAMLTVVDMVADRVGINGTTIGEALKSCVPMLVSLSAIGISMDDVCLIAHGSSGDQNELGPTWAFELYETFPHYWNNKINVYGAIDHDFLTEVVIPILASSYTNLIEEQELVELVERIDTGS